MNKASTEVYQVVARARSPRPVDDEESRAMGTWCHGQLGKSSTLRALRQSHGRAGKSRGA